MGYTFERPRSERWKAAWIKFYYHTPILTIPDRRRPMPRRTSRFFPTPSRVVIAGGARLSLSHRLWRHARRGWQWLAFWKF